MKNEELQSALHSFLLLPMDTGPGCRALRTGYYPSHTEPQALACAEKPADAGATYGPPLTGTEGSGNPNR